MYYLSWILFLIVLFLWKRDIRKIKESYRYILDEMRKERKDLDTLREKYISLLDKDKELSEQSS